MARRNKNRRVDRCRRAPHRRIGFCLLPIMCPAECGEPGDTSASGSPPFRGCKNPRGFWLGKFPTRWRFQGYVDARPVINRASRQRRLFGLTKFDPFGSAWRPVRESDGYLTFLVLGLAVFSPSVVRLRHRAWIAHSPARDGASPLGLLDQRIRLVARRRRLRRARPTPQ
jgi:hypothetical protein